MLAKLLLLFASRVDALGGSGNPFTDIALWPITAGGGSRALNGSALTVTYAVSTTAVSRAFTVSKSGVVFIKYKLANMTGSGARILVSNNAADAARLVGTNRTLPGEYVDQVYLPAGTYYLDLNVHIAGAADYSEARVMARR